MKRQSLVQQAMETRSRQVEAAVKARPNTTLLDRWNEYGEFPWHEIEAVRDKSKVVQDRAKEAKNLSIATKMAKVMTEVGRVAKNGRNDFHRYSYATEADIVEEIRGSLSANCIVFFPSVKQVLREGELTHVEMEFRFIDGETGETLESTFWGCGQDKADKGLYKAYTGANKYVLLKTFLIPTGDEDDPEHDGKAHNPPQQEKPKIEKLKLEKPPAEPSVTITTAQSKELYITASKNGWSEEQVKSMLKKIKGYDSSSQIKAGEEYAKVFGFFHSHKPDEIKPPQEAQA